MNNRYNSRIGRNNENVGEIDRFSSLLCELQTHFGRRRKVVHVDVDWWRHFCYSSWENCRCSDCFFQCEAEWEYGEGVSVCLSASLPSSLSSSVRPRKIVNRYPMERESRSQYFLWMETCARRPTINRTTRAYSLIWKTIRMRWESRRLELLIFDDCVFRYRACLLC